MENRVRIKLISSTIVALLLFTVGLVAVSPPALAEKGQVLFTDIAGTPVKLWRVGETLYITVIDPDENRSSDKIDLIGADEWWFKEDQLGNKNPVIEVCDANTGDCESSRPEGMQLVLQETGVNTGVFRSKFGILIGKSVIGTRPTPNDGILEVQDNDTIYARYLDPTDDTDIDVDLAKIDRTRAIIKITDGAGNEIDLFHAGRDAVFVTVKDPDENMDPAKVDIIKDVVLERPRPNPDGTIEREILTLVETGPNTGVFRNPNSILLVDNVMLTPDNDLKLAVRDKDTIIAYYRSPAAVPIIPPRTRTDCHPDESIIKFCRTVPVSVKPGATFEVRVELTAKVNLELSAITDTLPTGLTLVSGSLTAFQANMGAGTTLTNTYQVRAGAKVGTFNISGTARAKPVGLPSRTFELTSAIEVSAKTATAIAVRPMPLKVNTIENSFVTFTREVPARVNAGDTFTVTVKITAKVDLELTAVSDTLSAVFTLVSGNLTAFKRNMKAGDVLTNTYQVRASEAPPPPPYTISGLARSKPPAQPSKTLTLDSSIAIGVVAVPLVGLGDPNDPRDFGLDVAKIAEPNPGTVTFTDITGREKTEFKIGEDLFIKVEDEDLNTDSDRVERVTVRVYSIAGGIEEVELIETGVNSSTFRNTQFVKIEGGDPTKDKPDDGRIIVGKDEIIYVHFVDDPERSYDAYDVDFAAVKIFDSQVFSPTVNNIRFTDDRGNPVPSYKMGMDAFVEINDPDQNFSASLVDTFTIIVLDKNTGDREEVMMEETGPNTGIFRSHEGIPLRRPVPKAVHNDGILQVEDRDVIEAHYQDTGNPADFSIAKINIIPVPVWVPTPSTTSFTDAAGRDVTEYGVGDNVFVKVTDPDENRTKGVPDVIKGALTVENVRTGQSVKVDLTETGPDTGVFMTAAITTSVGKMLQVEDGDILRAEYVDPNDPTDRSSDTANIITVELRVTAWRNTPNPFNVKTTFEAIGTGILRIKVQVYDLSGRLVFEGEAAGSKLDWDGRDKIRARLPNGVYLYIMTATGRQNKTLTSPIMKLVIAR